MAFFLKRKEPRRRHGRKGKILELTMKNGPIFIFVPFAALRFSYSAIRELGGLIVGRKK